MPLTNIWEAECTKNSICYGVEQNITCNKLNNIHQPDFIANNLAATMGTDWVALLLSTRPHCTSIAAFKGYKTQ